MSKNLHWYILGLTVLGLCALVFFHLFEVVEDDVYFPPSQEAQINEYLALDRWLIKEAYNVKLENTGNIDTLKTAMERTILIQTELFDWDAEALDYLEQWVEAGGSLILTLSFYRSWDNDDELGNFLHRLGLEADTSRMESRYPSESDAPSFGRNIRFMPPMDENAVVLKDGNDAIRLVQFSRGEGKITVCSRPHFMTSVGLAEEVNARLSWYLLAGTGDILFIRGERPSQRIIGRIFELGNFSFIIISAMALIILSFWSVIPLFGVVKVNEEGSGKVLAERFLAEGIFYSRFGALECYRTYYVREIRRRLMKRENLRDEEIIPKAASLIGIGIGDLEKVIAPGPQKKNEFTKSIIILKTILEHL